MDLDEKICFCGKVTAGMIKASVEKGNDTLEKVMEDTGASTHCGRCKNKVAELVEAFKK